jgi:hypothetical protein
VYVRSQRVQYTYAMTAMQEIVKHVLADETSAACQ